MATSELIQWLPKIARATDEDIASFGPQAARVRALLDFIPGMSRDAWDAVYNIPLGTRVWDTVGDDVWDTAWGNAGNAAGNAAGSAVYMPTRRGPGNVKWNDAWEAAGNAARAEVVNDLIDPQTYRTLTDPLNAGRVYDLRAPEAGSEFMRLVDELRPTSADDIERLADLSVDPRVQGILELLGGLQGGMPLAAKIDAARRLDRVSRAGRRMQ